MVSEFSAHVLKRFIVIFLQKQQFLLCRYNNRWLCIQSSILNAKLESSIGYLKYGRVVDICIWISLDVC